MTFYERLANNGLSPDRATHDLRVCGLAYHPNLRSTTKRGHMRPAGTDISKTSRCGPPAQTAFAFSLEYSIKYDPLNDLIHAIPTSRLLLQKAHEEGALIEGLCLYVSTIDALLRLALVYSRTQKAPNYTYSIPKELIRQDEGEKT